MSVPLTALPLAASALSSTSSTAGLPVSSQVRAPAAVREGSPAAKQAYASAQGFEELLISQLSQSLLQSSGLGGEGESEGESSGEGGEGTGAGGSSQESGGGMLTSLLPQTLTESLMREGGLGLAPQLMSSLDPSAGVSAKATHGAGVASAGVSGGVSAGGVGGAGSGGGGVVGLSEGARARAHARTDEAGQSGTGGTSA
jgi:hypothetical protein